MFKKYNSIENSYRTRTIQKFNNYHSDITNVEYVVTEKVDGANIQLYFTPNSELKVGKRTAFIGKDENFFDIWNVIEKYKTQFDKIQKEVVNKSGVAIRIYGEIYGSGIQKRIDYGPDKNLIFFDVYYSDELQAPCVAEKFFSTYDLQYVPVLGIFDSLAEALTHPNTLKTNVGTGTDETKLTMEGVVIRPYLSNYYLQEELFILKNKNEEFNEKMNVKVSNKQIDSKVVALNLEFRNYINENRLQSVFSKHGVIKEPKQIGDYIRMTLEDAKEDFLKDHNIEGIEAKDLKSVYSVGNDIIKMLKVYL